MRWPARWFAVAILLGTVVPVSHAQDGGNNPDELNRKYQDALTQLKAAQDRKNELATENEKLNAKVADLEKQLESAHREQAEFAQRTFQLRSHMAAWEAFARRYPKLLEQWKLFITADPLALPSQMPDWDDAD